MSICRPAQMVSPGFALPSVFTKRLHNSVLIRPGCLPDPADQYRDVYVLAEVTM